LVYRQDKIVPRLRGADMTSRRTTDAYVERSFRDRAFFHGKLYLFENHYFKREKFSGLY
jgi:hypothetical protein